MAKFGEIDAAEVKSRSRIDNVARIMAPAKMNQGFLNSS
jgi:hypothetical protein